MDRMPHPATVEAPTVAPIADARQTSPTCWRATLPVLSDGRVTLRPLRVEDATSLFAMLTTEEVTRFISPPPPDLGAFERFIEWSNAEQRAGRFVAFAIVPAGYKVAVGIVQVRQLNLGFSCAEWGIAIGSPFWGTGVFPSTARLFLDFVFDEIGVHRLEGRAAVQNGRANGALRKIGAVQEGLLRSALFCNGRHFDQLLWSILADDWREARTTLKPRVH